LNSGFAPKFFESYESLNTVKSNLPDTDILEVKRPKGWDELREEARTIFEKKIRIIEYPIPEKLLDYNGKYNNNQVRSNFNLSMILNH